ncbi:Ser/Thr protein phosphatase protein [Trametes elegans]|nr:Ser/Thr protein phosphatase protein [Trametes elegans]
MSISPNIRIQVLSDLHLEFPPPRWSTRHGRDSYQYELPAEAEILALLGDIGVTDDDRLYDWLRIQLQRFKLVFFLAGNHEPYGSSIEQSTAKLSEFAEKCALSAEQHGSGQPSGRFVFLNRTRYDLSDSVTVLGCTLWSRLDPARKFSIRLGLTDFSQITQFTPRLYQSLHAQDLSWLERSISDIAASEPHRRIIVMTHHAPTVAGTSNPRYAGSPISSAFATELVGGLCWVEQVKVWAFGHTHWACDFEREGVRVVSNPKGYQDGGKSFKPGFVVNI